MGIVLNGEGHAGGPARSAASCVAAALGLLAFAASAIAPAVAADQGALLAQAGQQYSFDIPAQPLATALPLFGEQAGLQVSTDGNLVQALRTQGVSGSRTVEAALQQLLAGTGLTGRFVDAATVTLERAVLQEERGPIRLDPIRVEGQRVIRTPFETSSSLTVFTEERTESLPSAREVDDLLVRTPNITNTGLPDQGVVIRGVNSTGPLRGATQAVGGAPDRAPPPSLTAARSRLKSTRKAARRSMTSTRSRSTAVRRRRPRASIRSPAPSSCRPKTRPSSPNTASVPRWTMVAGGALRVLRPARSSRTNSPFV